MHFQNRMIFLFYVISFSFIFFAAHLNKTDVKMPIMLCCFHFEDWFWIDIAEKLLCWKFFLFCVHTEMASSQMSFYW